MKPQKLSQFLLENEKLFFLLSNKGTTIVTNPNLVKHEKASKHVVAQFTSIVTFHRRCCLCVETQRGVFRSQTTHEIKQIEKNSFIISAFYEFCKKPYLQTKNNFRPTQIKIFALEFSPHRRFHLRTPFMIDDASTTYNNFIMIFIQKVEEKYEA
jgi:hypothetical protein